MKYHPDYPIKLGSKKKYTQKDIDKLKKFAKKYKIKLIEDAAQSFGAEYKGKKVGSLVDLTCFSFNPVKNLGAMGDAGAVTGPRKLIDKVKMQENFIDELENRSKENIKNNESKK